MSPGTIINDELNNLIEEALSGSYESAKKFFQVLLKAELTAIDRYSPKLSNSKADYPSSTFPYYSVYHDAKNILPIFTRPERIPAWTEKPLETKATNFATLTNILPENWWIIINPNSDAEKELSPWEIEKLKLGENSIPEIIEELFSDDSGITADFIELEEDEYTNVKESLIKVGNLYSPKSSAVKTNSAILVSKIFLIKEVIKSKRNAFEVYETESKDVNHKLMIYVQAIAINKHAVDNHSSKNKHFLKTLSHGNIIEIENVIKKELSLMLIGDLKFEISVEEIQDAGKQQSAKSILFTTIEPIYVNNAVIRIKQNSEKKSDISQFLDYLKKFFNYFTK